MANRLTLDGIWELAGFDEGQGDWSWPEDRFPIPAPVPGEVHPALQAAGLIPDPFYARNVDRVQWVEEKEWWYRRRFRLPKGFARTQTFLEFDGLDTFATVLLNGEVVGDAKNMFTRHRFDVTGKLKERGENLLEVRFAPAARVVSRMDLKRYKARYHHDRIGARKMQASFGWDWMPRLVGAGIWRGARLVSFDRLSVRDLHVQATPGEGEATIRLAIEIDNHLSHSLDATLTIAIRGHGPERGITLARRIPTGGALVNAEMRLPDVKRWWPNGLGEQALYTARVEVRAEGDLLDEHEQRFGVRTIELRECDDAGNPAFYFVVNGMPVFARGANWLPPDAFPSRVTQARYRELLQRARDAHFNMLRVWGGAIYESSCFYDLCDELGLMVWQDFQFSLAEYPETEEFTGMVQREAHTVVKELRHHPCIALWCGNNECELDVQAGTAWQGKRLFHEVIPSILRELDPERPFWPASPFGGPESHSAEYGDYHGEPWFHAAKGFPDRWRQCIINDSGRFMSEFPTQGPPEIETLCRFLPDADLFPVAGPVWETHLQNNEHRQGKTGYTGRELLLRLIRGMMGEPRSAEEFALLGGVLQGEFVTAQIGYYRRHKFHIGGALAWCFNSVWPAVDYSMVDYYARPKPAYYYVKRAFAPVSLVFDCCGDEVIAWVINDRPEPLTGMAFIGRLREGEPDGVMQRMPVFVPANGVREVWRGRDVKDPRRQWRIGTLEVGGEVVSRASHFSTFWREVCFPEAMPRVEREYRDGLLRFTLAADTYARTLSLVGLPDGARPTDNYFDLFPGEARCIAVPGLSREEAERVRVRCGLTPVAEAEGVLVAA